MSGSKPMLVLHLALDSAAFDGPAITMVSMQLIAPSPRSLKQMRAVQIPKQVTSSHSGVLHSACGTTHHSGPPNRVVSSRSLRSEAGN